MQVKIQLNKHSLSIIFLSISDMFGYFFRLSYCRNGHLIQRDWTQMQCMTLFREG